MNSPLSTEAKSLLDDLITLAGFAPRYYEGIQPFQQRCRLWDRITDRSESSFKELQSLIEPERETMTDGELLEYYEQLNERAKEPLR